MFSGCDTVVVVNRGEYEMTVTLGDHEESHVRSPTTAMVASFRSRDAATFVPRDIMSSRTPRFMCLMPCCLATRDAKQIKFLSMHVL